MKSVLVERTKMGKDLNGKELGKGLQQRKNGSYEGRYIDAFGMRKSIYSRDLKELRKTLNDKIYEANHHLSNRNENLTLDQWFEDWLEVYKRHIVKQNTLLLYKNTYYGKISPTLGKRKIITISKIQVQALINKLSSDGYSWSVQETVRRILNDMYGRAIEDNFAIKNPTKGIRLHNKEEYENYKVLTKEEQSMFFETSAGTFYDNLFNVAVNTGLRSGELFALRWQDIDFEKKVIKVERNLVYAKYETDEVKQFHIETPKTAYSIREVPINNICEKYLKRQYMLKCMLSRKYPNKTEFRDILFVTSRNTPLNTSLMYEAIKRIVDIRNETLDDMEKMDVFGGHTFRHTFATRCIEAGVKPKTLQAYLGHATLEMTMNLYVHTMDDVKQEEIELLEQNINTLSSDEFSDKAYEKVVNGNIIPYNSRVRMA